MVSARFGNNEDTELLFAPSNDQPWWWSGSGWEQMSGSVLESGFMVPFDADGASEAFAEDEVAGDFGAAGLRLYSYGTNDVLVSSWSRMTESNPAFMVKSGYYGDGKKSALIGWFGSGTGLWIYRTGSWARLTNTTPDSAAFQRRGRRPGSGYRLQSTGYRTGCRLSVGR